MHIMAKFNNFKPDSVSKLDLKRHVPLAVILVIAIIGAFTLRDYLTFDTLRDNREALLAYRDANLIQTAFLFFIAYVLIVGFSLPGQR